MTGPTRVLFIEDSPGDARLVREELGAAGAGIRLAWVERLDDGLAHLAGEPVDAVLLDLSLPDSSGLETLARVLEAAPAVPVIVMTGTADERLAIQAVQAGAQDYLVKGQSAGLLARAIRYAIERKRISAELGEAHRLTDLILTFSPVGKLTYRFSGECVFANDRAAEMVGATIEQLRSQNFRELDSWRTSGLFDLAERAIASAAPEAADVHIETTFGRDAWLSARFTSFKSAGEELLLLAITDITVRKRSEERFRLVAEASPNAILLADPQGRIVMVNSRAETTFGYDRAGLLGLELDRLVPVRMRADHAAYRAGYHADPEPRLMGEGRDLYGLRKDESEFPVEIGLSPIETEEGPLVMATVIDITERKRSEDRIRYQALLLESVSDVIVATDLDGRIRSWNRAAERIFGYSETEVLGKPSDEVLQTDYLAGTREAAAAHMRETGSWAGEVRIRGRDGRAYYTLASASVIRDPAGRPIGYLSVNHDITERKLAEESLQLRLAELEAVARTAAALRGAVTRTELLTVIQEEVMAILGAEAVAFVMRDPTGDGAVVEAAIGEYAVAVGDRIPPGQGVTWETIETGWPYVSNDWQNDPRLSHPHLHAGLQAIVCSPLIEGDTTLGALWIGRTAPIEHDDLRLLTAIADMAATAIHRATLLDQTLRQVSRLGALRELDTAIMSSFDLQLTLDVLLKQVRTHLEVDAAAVLLLDPHSLYLEAAAWIGYRGKGPSGLRLRLGEGFGGQAALDRQVVHVPELTEDDPRIDKRGMVAEEGFAALISLPLIAKGRVSGVLEVFHRSPLPVHPEWLDFLETLAGQAAIAIEDARLYEDLQQSNLELTLAYDTTIEGWSRALDLRDKETEGHSRRVTELTLRLARGMGIGEAELVHIRRGALLHDIGKMGVPDQILLKPGPLTDAEWAIMTKHPVYAHELLAPIAYLRPALDIPHDHHEKWDGSGYPRGLKGDAIPLAARIFAVADVWDALRSDRPYRPTWTKEKALEYIVAESGRHFDPAVVEAFLEILDE